MNYINTVNPSQPQIINLVLIIFAIMIVALVVEVVGKWLLKPKVPEKKTYEIKKHQMLGAFYEHPEPKNLAEYPDRTESVWNVKAHYPDDDFHFERNPYINNTSDLEIE